MNTELLSINREFLFSFISQPLIPHNPFYNAATDRCIELFLEHMENRDSSQDFIGWFKLRYLYSVTAQYGLARTTVYHADGHNKILEHMAEAYKELYVRIKQITQSNLWDTPQ